MSRLTGWFLAAACVLAASLALAGGPSSEEHTPSRADRVTKTADEWKAELSAEEFHVLREKGTERAFTGEFWDDKAPGVYTCGGCGLELFDAKTKYKSGTGWPSFYEPIAKDVIDEVADNLYGMRRVEVVCARCGGHLGHVFPDGPRPTGLRYCINGTALDKVEAPSTPDKAK